MILIQQAHVYAPADLGTCDVLLGGGTILRIAPHLPVEPLYGVTCLDGSGCYLIPGLIDCHVHLLGGGGEGGYHTRTPEIMLSDILTAGVTTVVGCIGTDGATRHMASLIAKARGLEAEGISAYVYTGSYQVPVRTLTGSIMDDIILLDKVIGAGEIALSDHRSSQPSFAEFARAVAEARTGGILSGKAGLVNIHMGDGKSQLSYLRRLVTETEIPPFNLLPTHMNRNRPLFEDGLSYVRDLGGYIDLTTSFDKDHMEDGEVRACTGYKMALQAGVPDDHVTFSSDGQGSMPIFSSDGAFVGLGVGKVTSLYDEFRDAHLLEGIPLAQALKPVTSTPASLLKLPRKGRIAEEADADCVLIDQKTLAVQAVIAKGIQMMANGNLMKMGTFQVGRA